VVEGRSAANMHTIVDTYTIATSRKKLSTTTTKTSLNLNTIHKTGSKLTVAIWVAKEEEST
jgi:hypothetical protein